MFKKNFFFFLEAGQFFSLVLISNLIFFLNADNVLILVLIFLFSCILIFSKSEFNFLIKKEKLDIFNNFLLLINDIKKNYLSLNTLYMLNFSFFFNFFFNFWFANNLIYRCFRFKKRTILFSGFLLATVKLIIPKKPYPFFFDDYKLNFFNY